LPAAHPMASSADRLGLEDWWRESGIDEQYYKPESFDLPALADPTRGPLPHRLDVTLRAVVMYNATCAPWYLQYLQVNRKLKR
jgi:hypothetical protein